MIKTPLTDTVFLRLAATQRACESYLRAALAPAGLYVGQEQVLILLAAHGQMNLAPLAETLDMKPPTLTKMLARLEVQGMVHKIADGEDGRKFNVKITDKGTEASVIALAAHVELNQKIEDILGEKDTKKLRKLMKEVLKNT